MNFELCFLTLVEWICTQKFSLIILYKQHLSWPSHSLTPFLLYSHLKVKHRLKEKKNKTNQANIFYICCGRWQETGDFRNLTASNTVRWGLLKTNGTQDKTWGTTLSLTYALHATSSIRHAVGTRNNPSQKCAELRTMVACKNQKWHVH